MGTLTTKLTVSGSAADYGSALNLSVSDSLSVDSPSRGLSRIDVAAAATEVLFADSGANGTTFLYVKNNNTSGSGYVELQIDNGNATFGTLENGEWAWIPVDSNEGVQVLGAGATVEVEFAYWTRK
jgi:hypothetical protein